MHDRRDQVSEQSVHLQERGAGGLMLLMRIHRDVDGRLQDRYRMQLRFVIVNSHHTSRGPRGYSLSASVGSIHSCNFDGVQGVPDSQLRVERSMGEGQ